MPGALGTQQMQNNFNPLYIGIAGNARSGKDTLANAISELFAKEGKLLTISSLAAPLKEACYSFILENFGINIYNCGDEEKRLIRPILVEFGRIKRVHTKGRYFTDELDSHVKTLFPAFDGVIIPDIRYADYESDELCWLRNKRNILIFVDRILPDGTLVKPANEDEARNNTILREQADIRVEWETLNNDEIKIIKYVKNTIWKRLFELSGY